MMEAPPVRGSAGKELVFSAGGRARRGWREKEWRREFQRIRGTGARGSARAAAGAGADRLRQKADRGGAIGTLNALKAWRPSRRTQIQRACEEMAYYGQGGTRESPALKGLSARRAKRGAGRIRLTLKDRRSRRAPDCGPARPPQPKYGGHAAKDTAGPDRAKKQMKPTHHPAWRWVSRCDCL